MNAVVTDAVEVALPLPSLSKFDRERQAFERLLPTLLASHRGQYVAVHNELVADHGDSRLEVALRVLKKVGNVDIYVGLVSETSESPSRSGVRRSLTPAEILR